MRTFASRRVPAATRRPSVEVQPAPPRVAVPGHDFARLQVMPQRRGTHPRAPLYPRRRRCEPGHDAMVIAAFNEGLQNAAQALNRMIDYLTNASDRGNCRLVRNALQAHFGWTEAIRTQMTFPDLPCHIVTVLENLLANPPNPVTAFCDSNQPTNERGVETLANAGGPPGEYTFYDPFFGPTAVRAQIAVHEMMHKPGNMTDVAYRGLDGHYGTDPRSMFNNPDSHAWLVHDLRRPHPVVGTNPCVNGVLPRGTTTACGARP